MSILYVVLLLCLVALLWAALAVARTIRRHDRDRRKPPAGSSLGLLQAAAPRPDTDEDAAS
jgi:hypothetical protein